MCEVFGVYEDIFHRFSVTPESGGYENKETQFLKHILFYVEFWYTYYLLKKQIYFNFRNATRRFSEVALLLSYLI